VSGCETIARWPEESREAARVVIDKYASHTRQTTCSLSGPSRTMERIVARRCGQVMLGEVIPDDRQPGVGFESAARRKL
jgi:hypothetical protein